MHVQLSGSLSFTFNWLNRFKSLIWHSLSVMGSTAGRHQAGRGSPERFLQAAKLCNCSFEGTILNLAI